MSAIVITRVLWSLLCWHKVIILSGWHWRKKIWALKCEYYNSVHILSILLLYTNDQILLQFDYNYKINRILFTIILFSTRLQLKFIVICQWLIWLFRSTFFWRRTKSELSETLDRIYEALNYCAEFNVALNDDLNAFKNTFSGPRIRLEFANIVCPKNAGQLHIKCRFLIWFDNWLR